MLQDRTQKRPKKPGRGGAADAQDLSAQVPEVDDVLGEVDAALAKSESIRNRIRGKLREREKREREQQSRGRCGC